MANPAKNSPVAEQVKDLLSSDSTPVAQKCAKVALAAADAAAGVLSWQNPESSAIVITRMVLDVTTAATAACTLDVGTDGDGTGSSDVLLDGLDVNAAAGVFDNIADKGTNGKEPQRLDAKGGTTDYVTASKPRVPPPAWWATPTSSTTRCNPSNSPLRRGDSGGLALERLQRGAK